MGWNKHAEIFSFLAQKSVFCGHPRQDLGVIIHWFDGQSKLQCYVTLLNPLERGRGNVTNENYTKYRLKVIQTV